MPVFHITTAERRRRRIFADRYALFDAVHTLTSCSPDHRLLFCIADEHTHDVIEADDLEAAGAIASGTHRSLESLGIDLGHAYVREVENRRHFQWLLDYVTRQALKHDLPEAALWPGSCLLDLLGLRVLPHFDPQAIWAHLPRRRPASLLAPFGLPFPTPTDPEDLRALVEAAELVFARPIDVQTRPPRGRAVVAALASDVQTSAVARALGVRWRGSVHRLADRATPTDVERVRLAAGFIRSVRATPSR